ncbi:hypothetical protein [Mesobacillus harenae]|uniref:hypothetical protein n=1 Tax=Mesobacillus harenae TaxID=2213203 RepID=UPI001580908F|nr:hypothetical protein [Mesobacillus harenae]
MKKNRYILCLLLSAFMLYFAVPRLSITASGLDGLFSIAWLGLALCVVAGNLTALLYSANKRAKEPARKTVQGVKSRSRVY